MFCLLIKHCTRNLQEKPSWEQDRKRNNCYGRWDSLFWVVGRGVADGSECFCGAPPFNRPNPMQLLANIEKCKALEFGGKCALSERGKEFLGLLLEKDPSRRLASGLFMDHAYVSSDFQLDETHLCLFDTKENEVSWRNFDCTN